MTLFLYFFMGLMFLTIFQIVTPSTTSITEARKYIEENKNVIHFAN